MAKLFARDVHTLHHNDIDLENDDFITTMRRNIEQGDTYVVKGGYDRQLLERIRDYLVRIGRNSYPNYHPIEEGCHNFHRMNKFDDRAYVKGCFHQFSFLPWNQDVFNLYDRFKEIYFLKNKLSQLPANKFISHEVQEGCTARMSFQFYPNGGGMLNAHADPKDRHQLTVPIMLMSQKGEDFQQGGGYVMASDGSEIILDDIAGWGDVIYFNAQVVHGVAPINPEDNLDWLAFKGRWMLLFAVNKLASTTDINNSIDYNK